MRRCWTDVGRRVVSSSFSRPALPAATPRRFHPVASPVITSIDRPFSSDHLISAGFLRRRPPDLGFRPSVPLPAMQQVRGYAAKERSRAPITPTKSKVKKYKLKAPSSMKFRFRTMNDGQIRRWRAGKRHNAHLKSKKSKRRLRKPEVVHLAYAKVIKKLNFCG